MNTHPDPWQAAQTVTADTPEATASDTTLMNKLPQLLRLAGASALLVAMYSFLVQGWQDSNDLIRYLMLLGHSLTLAGIALASGYWLQEHKGARLLMTLALVSVPANFAVLGAFLYAHFGAQSTMLYPHYALWRIESLSGTLLTLSGASVLLIPLVLIGFRVLARGLSRQLAGLFLLSNAVLLIPLRDPQLVAALGLPLALLAMLSNGRSKEDHLAARTPDGLIARLLQYLPLTLLLGRSLWLYAADAFLFTSALLMLFIAARQFSLILPGQSTLRGALEGCSCLLALMVGPGLSITLGSSQLAPDALLIPAGTLAASALLYELSLRAGMAFQLYRVLAMLVLLTGMFGNLAIFGGLSNALLCIAGGAALAVYGHLHKQLALFGSGLLLAASALLHQLYQVVVFFDLGNWASLGVLGVLAILLGSLLESRGGRLRPALTALRRGFARWEF